MTKKFLEFKIEVRIEIKYTMTIKLSYFSTQPNKWSTHRLKFKLGLVITQ